MYIPHGVNISHITWFICSKKLDQDIHRVSLTFLSRYVQGLSHVKLSSKTKSNLDLPSVSRFSGLDMSIFTLGKFS